MIYVYVIECKTPNHYYIGLTADYERRIRRHKEGGGARFVKVHGFKRVVRVEFYELYYYAKERELKLTEYFIHTYGIENVAGAHYSQVLKGKLLKEPTRKS